MWTTSRTISTSPATVWDVLTDLRSWPQWGPTVSAARLADGDDLRLGSTGSVRTPVGVWLPFEITRFEPGRRWSWTVAGVPATEHGVEPAGSGCRAWMAAPVWAPAYLPVLAIALRRIESLATPGR